MLETLHIEHDAILRAADELLAAVKRPTHISQSELMGRRVKLARLIQRHRETEERLIYAPMLGRCGLISQPRIKALLQHIQQEKSRCREDGGNWTLEAIQADWTGYVRHVQSCVDGLRDLIRTEEEEFFPPLLHLAAA